MDGRTYRRLFCETPRQRLIRHNWPTLCGRMTKAERRAHVEGLRSHAESLRSKGDRVGAETIERSADAFAARYPYERRRRVSWSG